MRQIPRHVTRSMITIWFALLFGAGAGLAAEPAGNQMESSALTAKFDAKTGGLTEVLNRATQSKLVLEPVNNFTITWNVLPPTGPIELEVYNIYSKTAEKGSLPSHTLAATNCVVKPAQVTALPGSGTKRSVTYVHELAEVEVIYTLGATDHFLEKQLVFRPKFKERHVLRSVATEQFKVLAGEGKRVLFEHSQCLEIFLRGEKDGFFSGLNLPVNRCPLCCRWMTTMEWPAASRTS